MIITRAPLRISLCGGGTDIRQFYERGYGKTLTCAIDKYVYAIIKKRFDNLIVLNYTQHEVVDKVSDIKHEIIKACLELFDVKGGIEISTLADIPSQGSGLGSSSAITVALIQALSGYEGYLLSTDQLAQLACHVEINTLGRMLGKQDQYAVAYGGIKELTFKANDSVTISSLEGCGIEDNLFLHYTNQTRSSDGILREVVGNFDRDIQKLMELRELTEELIERLRDGNTASIGMALRRNWGIKKSQGNSVSNYAIDTMVSKAILYGATGCKICGAGGGGFLLSYVPESGHMKFKEGMSEYRELKFKIDPYGARVIFNIQ